MKRGPNRTEARRPSDHPDFLLQALLQWRTADQHSDFEARNAVGLRVLGNANLRRISREGCTVETWWDRISRNWFTWDFISTETLDSAGERAGASLNHMSALCDRLLGREVLLVDQYPGKSDSGDYRVTNRAGKLVVDKSMGWLVAQFLRAVEDPNEYDVDSAVNPEEGSQMAGEWWLAENSALFPPTSPIDNLNSIHQ